MKRKMRLTPGTRRRLPLAIGAVVLAFGVIVLARARGSAAPIAELAPPAPESRTRATFDGDELDGFFALTQGAVLAGGTRELFGELRLEAHADRGVLRRRPVALAVALDVSGSMTGDKIVQARAAVRQLAERMHPEDQLAVVVYNHEARVLIPLASVGAVRAELASIVGSIEAAGGTNIPAGLSVAAMQLADAASTRTHRLVLVSDGLDGSGLSLATIRDDVQARALRGTTTSALGVGIDYDEPWLTSVADAGRGNYEFVSGGIELASFLTRELDQAASTIAEGTELAFDLPAGIRISRVYGASSIGSRLPLGALFAGERRRVTVRFEVDAAGGGAVQPIGVRLAYRRARDGVDRNFDAGRLSLLVVNDPASVDASRDVVLHAEAVAQDVDARQASAIEAWRSGDVQAAQRLTRENLATLEQWRQRAPRAAPALESRMRELRTDYDNIGSISAGSGDGRAYGLTSNARRRARTAAF